MTPYCPRRSNCGKKGAKATCSWPRARSMAARADRSRGLFRRAKAMASPSAKIVGLASGLSLGNGSGNRWLGSPGLTTVSAGLTFRSGGIRTRAVTAASETSGGMGKGRCQEAQPARKRRATSTPVWHSSPRVAAGTRRKGRPISEPGVKGLLPSASIAPCCSGALGGSKTDYQSVLPHGRCLSPLVARELERADENRPDFRTSGYSTRATEPLEESQRRDAHFREVPAVTADRRHSRRVARSPTNQAVLRRGRSASEVGHGPGSPAASGREAFPPRRG